MQFKISEDDIDKRLDHFLTEKVDEFSRSQIQKMIKTEHICVNGNPVKTGYKLELDDIITFSDVDVETDETPIEPEDIPLDIVYEDDDVISFLDIMPANKGHCLVVPKKQTSKRWSCCSFSRQRKKKEENQNNPGDRYEFLQFIEHGARSLGERQP